MEVYLLTKEACNGEYGDVVLYELFVDREAAKGVRCRKDVADSTNAIIGRLDTIKKRMDNAD